MSLKIKLIVRTVPIWPILGKMAADVYPQEGICIPGAAHHLSPVRRKIPGLHLLLPLGREKQLRDRVGQEPMHFLARTQSGGEGRAWRKAPCPSLPSQNNLCLATYTVARAASGKETRLSFLFSFAPLKQASLPLAKHPSCKVFYERLGKTELSGIVQASQNLTVKGSQVLWWD